MKTLFAGADIPRCRRCGKRLSDDIGLEDSTGGLDVGWVCDSCGRREEQRAWSHSYIRARIAAVNTLHRDES